MKEFRTVLQRGSLSLLDVESLSKNHIPYQTKYGTCVIPNGGLLLTKDKGNKENYQKVFNIVAEPIVHLFSGD